MKVQALRVHSYAGRCYKVGSVYEVKSEKDLKTLILVKAVKQFQGEAPAAANPIEKDPLNQSEDKAPKARKSNYSRKDLKAAEEGEKAPRARKGNYKRKDLVAQESEKTDENNSEESAQNSSGE